MGNPTIIAIGGPTASGKTDAAIQLAKKHCTEIVSFDSRQLYKELIIGVARPTKDELLQCTHHGIANHSIQNPLSAGQFTTQYRPIIQSVLKQYGTAILVGGTGMYLQHLLFDFDEIPDVDINLRTTINQWYINERLTFLVSKLLEIDPEARTKIDINNSARVKRSLELCLSTGKPLNEIHQGKKTPAFPDVNIHIVGIAMERENLYHRINQRVDKMMADGLLQEVEQLSIFSNLPVLKTVGYTELFDYLHGSISLELAIEKIKQHSRNYAKRQITYFNRQFATHWLKKETMIDNY
jgi:tRNA dimethylallyltransferase